MSSLGSSQIFRLTGCFKASKHRENDKQKASCSLKQSKDPPLRRHHSPAFRAPCGLVAARRIVGSPRPFPEKGHQTQHASTCGKCSPAFSYSCNLPISRKASCSPSASPRSLAKRNRKPNAQLPYLLWQRWRSQNFDLIQLIDLFFSTCLASGIVFLPARTITTGCITRLTKRALPEVSTWITWRPAYNKSTLPLHTCCQIFLAKADGASATHTGGAQAAPRRNYDSGTWWFFMHMSKFSIILNSFLEQLLGILTKMFYVTHCYFLAQKLVNRQYDAQYRGRSTHPTLFASCIINQPSAISFSIIHHLSAWSMCRNDRGTRTIKRKTFKSTNAMQ